MTPSQLCELREHLLRQRQSAFIAWMMAVGKGWSDLTPAERAEAEMLRFPVPTFTPYCPSERVTISWKVL